MVKKIGQRIYDQGLWGFIALSFFILSLVFVYSEPAHDFLSSFFKPSERKILSVLSGELNRGGLIIRAVKVQTPTGIVVEVYGPIEDGIRPLIDQIYIPDPSDGYFQFTHRSSNLALQDLSGNGYQELIIPSYDSNLVPRLNVFKYSEATERFEPYAM